ncbi:hypothetical protein NEF87_000508 [Candidatus Lokiarchaeum ossiferum]|uniref:N-acetyltransferase domain-containing protein n=1 Tax=Candidatus Lokiarchaeum ossiferum TaxID=2951803 RepID=A0ABY6HLP2_9ARCH|nr:hypothetical protein NEF87_000508 [Candidatus Lokiarchaeum sp. B-35]
MLKGRTISLHRLEETEIPLVHRWRNNLDIIGFYAPLIQCDLSENMKNFGESTPNSIFFIITMNDKTPIGFASINSCGFPGSEFWEIGYMIIPEERGNGYASEAVLILSDFIFLSKVSPRIQAHVDVENIASKKLLEKVGYKCEGILRKNIFMYGEWRDSALYSLLREEWDHPRILPRRVNS